MAQQSSQLRYTTAMPFDEARKNLSTFVGRKAEEARRQVGFGWRPSKLAPATYDDVLREFKASTASSLPYRVSSLHCDNTVFLSPMSNYAMRFWHDMSHARFGLTFSADDEMELGIYHLQALMAAGFEPKSCEYRLLHADTIGQTLCMVETGHFPVRQMRFATTAFFHGINRAIAEETTPNTAGLSAELGGDAA